MSRQRLEQKQITAFLRPYDKKIHQIINRASRGRYEYRFDVKYTAGLKVPIEYPKVIKPIVKVSKPKNKVWFEDGWG